MNRTKNLPKDALFEFALTRRIANPVAITFTLKQAMSMHNRYGVHVHKNDAIDFSTNTRYFLNRLNQSVFGRRFTKYKQRLSVFPVLEGGNDVRFHTHLAIERPVNFDFDEFSLLVSRCWSKCPLGYNNIDVKEIANYEGWINYMLKNKTKSMDLLSSVDVENLYLN